uniref:Aminopeptidase n=2 Tax=Cacopsylla melanoneura TaxID=428564 RepID=A0A8D8TSY1_9HEMI
MSLMKVSLLLGMASIGLTIAVVFLCYSLYTSTCETNDDASSTSSPLMSSTLPASKTVWEKDFRLSPHIIPDLYEVKLHPDLVTGLFTCEEKISVRVLSRVDYIYLHIDRLNVSKSVVKQNGVSIPIKAAFSYPKHQYWVVTLERSLEVGECTLEFMADGNLRKQDIVGFYESKYKAINNETRLIATSKFEPTYARQAFPCFDEPSMKAKFLVKLVKPKDKYIALSNMNVKQSTEDSPGPNQTTVEFEVSVPMSTYLVCFIVCDFNALPSINSTQGFPINVYAREGQLENMKFAQDIAVKAINFYVEYFGIEYPLPKLDLIAIPDFVSGAMEHWGLVTFREASVLYKKGSSSVVNMKRVAMTTAHELAHMWFGDLVTMEWWNDLWLNEGFASFMQYKALAKAEPTWDVDTMFLTDMLHSTLQLDQTLSSHPIVQTVSNPDQITEIFDVISYQKGSSVIRMLENMMGEDKFSKGVNSYLKEFQFKNAETNHLWAHLQNFAGNMSMSVTDVMDTYTRQMGFPLITAKRSGDKVTFTQERYLANTNVTYDKNDSPFKYTWHVYITMTTSAAPNQTLSTWLYRNETEASISIPANTTWIKVNSHQVGYFRVNYEPDMWKILIDQLNEDHTVLDARDRSNLLDDAFNLAESQQIEYSTTFSLMKYLSKEDHFVPWTDVYNKLARLDDKMYDTEGHASFQKYIRCLLKDKLTPETWEVENKSFLEVNAKIVMNDLGCNFGMKVCLTKAEALLKTWLETGEKPNAELRGVVYRYGMETVGPEMWDKMWAKFKEETNPQEQMKMLGGLGSVKDIKQLEKFLEMAKDEKNIRSQDYFTVIMIVANNPLGLPIAWTYLQKNWDYLVKRFSLNHRVFGRIIPSVCGKFKTEARLKEVQNFFTKNPNAGAGAAGRKQAVETIQNNIKWVAKHGKPLAEWLKDNLCTDDV